MGKRKLEELVWVDEPGFHNDSDGEVPGYYARQDGDILDSVPFPVGEPISGYLFSFLDPYDLIRAKAKEQGLWDNAVNAYTLTISQEGFTPERCKVVSAQLFWLD